MNKRAISVTLSKDNLLWLRGRAMVNGKRSVSSTLDEIIDRVRLGGKPKNGKESKITSVVGTISISVDDPDLLKADASIREPINQSLDHTTKQLKGWENDITNSGFVKIIW